VPGDTAREGVRPVAIDVEKGEGEVSTKEGVYLGAWRSDLLHIRGEIRRAPGGMPAVKRDRAGGLGAGPRPVRGVVGSLSILVVVGVPIPTVTMRRLIDSLSGAVFRRRMRLRFFPVDTATRHELANTHTGWHEHRQSDQKD
jgi:hypothetical protein